MHLSRVAVEDTTIPYTSWSMSGCQADAETHILSVKKGSTVVLDLPAAGNNPAYWPDPEVFNPGRFIGNDGAKNKAQHLGWAGGQRVCIGKRFGEIEMCAILARLVKTYRFAPVPWAGETPAETERRILKGKGHVTLTPGTFELELTRR